MDKHEFLTEAKAFTYRNVHGEQIELSPGSVAYTICQVPVILQDSDEPGIEVHFSDGSIQHIKGHILDPVNSKHIFRRDGVLHHLIVSVT